MTLDSWYDWIFQRILSPIFYWPLKLALGLHEFPHVLHLLITYKIVDYFFVAGYIYCKFIGIIVNLSMAIVVYHLRFHTLNWIKSIIFELHTTILYIYTARLNAAYVKTWHACHTGFLNITKIRKNLAIITKYQLLILIL